MPGTNKFTLAHFKNTQPAIEMNQCELDYGCAFIFLCIINQMISNMEKEQYSSPCVKMLDVLLSYSLLDASGGGHDWNDTGDE